MTSGQDPIARPLPDDPTELRQWALDAAQEALSLRDRLVGAEAARERAEVELAAALDGSDEQSLYELLVAERRIRREQVDALVGELDRIKGSRVYRYGRRLSGPLRALRLWR